jgi:hypothetical protein
MKTPPEPSPTPAHGIDRPVEEGFGDDSGGDDSGGDDSGGDDRQSLRHLLGGPREAIEGAAPSVTFVVAYALAGASLAVALALALVVAAVVAAVRLVRRESLRHVLGGLAAVAIAAAVAARTGRAEDYFLPRVLANAGAALIWAASVLAGWPLLGVIVGAAVGQRTRWRSDPDLVRAYSRASWIWAASFVVRAAVMTPLYLAGEVLALGVAKVMLGWPMVLVVIWLSWLTIGRALPPDHPGLWVSRRRGPDQCGGDVRAADAAGCQRDP